jgi:hypothetical protein
MFYNKKIEGTLYCVLGFFMLIIFCKELLLELLALISGLILLFKGFRLLYPRTGYGQFFRFFQGQNRFF